MKHTASFLFHGALKDFLPKTKRGKPLFYSIKNHQSLKDAIEALGVPHPEVGKILLNQLPATFQTILIKEANIEVYPVDYFQQNLNLDKLQPALPAPIRFVLDVHLGSLARALRLLGFDCYYETNYTDSEIAEIATKEIRVVLTRDVGLLKQRIINWGYWLRSQHLQEQLKEVILRYKLLEQAKPFTRCMACNGLIQQVPKEVVLEALPLKTKMYFDEFFQCQNCRKVYWKGSHYERMQDWVKQLHSDL